MFGYWAIGSKQRTPCQAVAMKCQRIEGVKRNTSSLHKNVAIAANRCSQTCEGKLA